MVHVVSVLSQFWSHFLSAHDCPPQPHCYPPLLLRDHSVQPHLHDRREGVVPQVTVSSPRRVPPTHHQVARTLSTQTGMVAGNIFCGFTQDPEYTDGTRKSVWANCRVEQTLKLVWDGLILLGANMQIRTSRKTSAQSLYELVAIVSI